MRWTLDEHHHRYYFWIFHLLRIPSRTDFLITEGLQECWQRIFGVFLFVTLVIELQTKLTRCSNLTPTSSRSLCSSHDVSATMRALSSMCDKTNRPKKHFISPHIDGISLFESQLFAWSHLRDEQEKFNFWKSLLDFFKITIHFVEYQSTFFCDKTVRFSPFLNLQEQDYLC